ncbi:MAG: hypothetical protein ACI4KG_07455 [Oscillospiraceae bacterium]
MFRIFVKAVLDTLKPKYASAFFFMLLLPVTAAAAVFLKRTRFRNDVGADADLYVIGKKGNPKAVFVTNVKRKKALKTVSNWYLNSNFSE